MRKSMRRSRYSPTSPFTRSERSGSGAPSVWLTSYLVICARLGSAPRAAQLWCTARWQLMDTGTAMAIFIAKRVSDANAVWFRVSDSDGRSIPSCDDFLLHLRLRDCSVYTQRAYAIGLAHFLSWLHVSLVSSGSAPSRYSEMFQTCLQSMTMGATPSSMLDLQSLAEGPVAFVASYVHDAIEP